MEPDSAHDARVKSTRLVSTLKVGSTIWLFDGNHRKYTPASKGQLWTGSRLIYRACWVPAIITAETSRSWVVGPWKRKIPKTGPHHGAAFSAEEVDDDCWVKEHRHTLVGKIERVDDAAVLRKIAAIVGFVPDGLPRPPQQEEASP